MIKLTLNGGLQTAAREQHSASGNKITRETYYRAVSCKRMLGCDERVTPQLLSCPMVFERINEALLAHAITYLRNTKDLFKMAKETTRPTTTKRLPFPESTWLKLADAINQVIPRMCRVEMQLMSAFDKLQFQMISLHDSALSGSAPVGPLPFQ